MRAAIVRDFGQDFQIVDVDISDPIGKEVLIAVKASGLCHSDLTFTQTDYGMPLPLLPGHEIAGIVAAVGPEVDGFTVGDHVVATSVAACGQCDRCVRGEAVACRVGDKVKSREPGEGSRLHFEGRPLAQYDGLSGFAEQVLVHQNQLVAIDKRMPFDRAAVLGCAVITGAGAVFNTAKIRAGESVAVFGCGGVGLNIIQAAALSGARTVIGIDLVRDRLELAGTFGATATIDGARNDVLEEIARLTGGGGVDHAFEVAGVMITLNQAVRSLGYRGTAYIVGVQKPGSVYRLPVDAWNDKTNRLELGIRGVNMGSSRVRADIPLYCDLYLRGRFNLDDLVHRTIALEAINQGYDDMRRGVVARTVITFP